MRAGLLFCFIISSLSGPVAAQGPRAPADTQPVYLSFEDAVKLSLDGNPDLAALRAQEDAQKLRSKQSLAPNNPVFTYTGLDSVGLNPGLQPAEQVYQVSMTLGFPGKALSQSAVLRHQAEASREQATFKQIDLIVQLSNIYVSFAINDTFNKLLLDEQEKDKRLTKLLEKKFSTSQAAKVDLLNARVVSAQIQQDLLANKNEYEVLTTQFRQLIKHPERTELYPKVPQDVFVPELRENFEMLSKLMVKNNHSLLASDFQVAAAQSSLTLANLQPFPDFQLMAAMNIWNVPTAAVNPGVSRDYSFGVGIAIPLFFPFNEITQVRAARKDLMAADYQSQSAHLSAIASLQTAYTSLKAAEKELENLAKLVVPAAKASYDLTLLTYSLGKADFFQLNVSRKAWFDSQRDLLTKKQTVAQLYNQFLEQVGCDFSKKEGPYACVE